MYALISNNNIRYPYSITDLRFDNTNISFGDSLSDETLLEFNVYRVYPTPPPVISNTQILIENTPIFNGISNRYEQSWGVRDKTQQELINERLNKQNIIANEIQRNLDNFAQTRHYESILAACTYTSSPIIKYREEGLFCVQLRDITWNTFYDIIADVEAGTRAMPDSYNDIKNELPELSWPT